MAEHSAALQQAIERVKQRQRGGGGDGGGGGARARPSADAAETPADLAPAATELARLDGQYADGTSVESLDGASSFMSQK